MVATTKKRIEGIYVITATDRDGTEGIFGMDMDGMWQACVTSKERLLSLMLKIAVPACEAAGCTLKVLHFANREDVTSKFVK